MSGEEGWEKRAAVMQRWAQYGRRPTPMPRLEFSQGRIFVFFSRIPEQIGPTQAS